MTPDPQPTIAYREVVVPIELVGQTFRIDRRKNRSRERALFVLDKWGRRWGKRRGKHVCNGRILEGLGPEGFRWHVRWHAFTPPADVAPDRIATEALKGNPVTFRVFDPVPWVAVRERIG